MTRPHVSHHLRSVRIMTDARTNLNAEAKGETAGDYRSRYEGYCAGLTAARAMLDAQELRKLLASLETDVPPLTKEGQAFRQYVVGRIKDIVDGVGYPDEMRLDGYDDIVDAARDLLAAADSMPDAALADGDPRRSWWFEVLGPARSRMRVALGRLTPTERVPAT